MHQISARKRHYRSHLEYTQSIDHKTLIHFCSVFETRTTANERRPIYNLASNIPGHGDEGDDGRWPAFKGMYLELWRRRDYINKHSSVYIPPHALLRFMCWLTALPFTHGNILHQAITVTWANKCKKAKKSPRAVFQHQLYRPKSLSYIGQELNIDAFCQQDVEMAVGIRQRRLKRHVSQNTSEGLSLAGQLMQIDDREGRRTAQRLSDAEALRCASCGKSGHLTSGSKSCEDYKGRRKRTLEGSEEEEEEENEEEEEGREQEKEQRDLASQSSNKRTRYK